VGGGGEALVICTVGKVFHKVLRFTTGIGVYARARLYADGQMSGPSAYSLAGAAPKRNRRYRQAVGVEKATPRAALGVYLALGVELAWPPLPPVQ
jgi:hypothetical protein